MKKTMKDENSKEEYNHKNEDSNEEYDDKEEEDSKDGKDSFKGSNKDESMPKWSILCEKFRSSGVSLVSFRKTDTAKRRADLGVCGWLLTNLVARLALYSRPLTMESLQRSHNAPEAVPASESPA